jgi:hypothetical protein
MSWPRRTIYLQKDSAPLADTAFVRSYIPPSLDERVRLSVERSACWMLEVGKVVVKSVDDYRRVRWVLGTSLIVAVYDGESHRA